MQRTQQSTRDAMRDGLVTKTIKWLRSDFFFRSAVTKVFVDLNLSAGKNKQIYGENNKNTGTK